MNASLMGVQFAKDGDTFAGGGVSRADAFADISDFADDEDDLI